jgi:para-aminobenzoate synthetase component 1
MSQQDYEAAVLKAKQHIQAGDVFQVNLSLRFTTQTQPIAGSFIANCTT